MVHVATEHLLYQVELAAFVPTPLGQVWGMRSTHPCGGSDLLEPLDLGVQGELFLVSVDPE